MAYEWIKIEVVTPDKPEIYQLAEILAIDPDAVLGKLIRIWAWADQQTIDGNASSNATGYYYAWFASPGYPRSSGSGPHFQ